MAIETLRPNAAGDECNINSQIGAGCPNHYQNVDEAVADEDTTFVRENEDVNQFDRDLYALQNSGVGTGAINSVTIYVRCKEKTSGRTKTAIKTEGVVYEGNNTELTDAWVDYSTQYTTNPNTGIAWTWTQIDALQAGVALRAAVGGGTRRAECTQVYVEVDYISVTAKTSSDTGSGIDSKVSLLTPTTKTSSDAGSGSEGAPVPTAALAGSESGQGLEAISFQLAAITAVDSGTSVELGALLKDLFATELGRGADSFTAKIESPTRGGGMKLWT